MSDMDTLMLDREPVVCRTCGFKWWQIAKSPDHKCPKCGSVNIHLADRNKEARNG